jgi:MFS family permease
MTRHYGTRPTQLLGIVFETAALIGASFVTAVWQLFLSQGVCFGLGMGLLFGSNAGLIPQWFSTRRSLANGISSAGSGFGGLTYSLAANAMIHNVGLAWTFRIIGIIACIVNTICAILIRDRLKLVGSTRIPMDLRLLRRPEYIFLLLFGFFSLLSYVTLLFSLPSYADSIGLTATQGSIVGAILNLGQTLGRSPIGYFSDAFGRMNMGATMSFLAGLFVLVIWTNANTYGTLVFFALIGGMVAGTFWATIAPIATEVLGLQDLPSGLGLNYMVLALPTTFSEAIALRLTAINGGRYLGAQL